MRECMKNTIGATLCELDYIGVYFALWAEMNGLKRFAFNAQRPKLSSVCSPIHGENI